MTRRLMPVATSAIATATLTAAIFLLPATSDRRPARAGIDDIKVSAHHIDIEPASAGGYRH